MGYQYSIVHRPGSELGFVVGLSRLPVPTVTKDATCRDSPANRASELIPSYGRSHQILDGPRPVPGEGAENCDAGLEKEVKPYADRKGELSVKDSYLLWSTRVIVPPQLRSKVLNELHEEFRSELCVVAGVLMWTYKTEY